MKPPRKPFTLHSANGAVLCRLECEVRGAFLTAEMTHGQLEGRLLRLAKETFAAGNAGTFSLHPDLELQVQDLQLTLRAEDGQLANIMSLGLRDDGLLNIGTDVICS